MRPKNGSTEVVQALGLRAPSPAYAELAKAMRAGCPRSQGRVSQFRADCKKCRQAPMNFHRCAGLTHEAGISDPGREED
jgi:hypothetical protein